MGRTRVRHRVRHFNSENCWGAWGCAPFSCALSGDGVEFFYGDYGEDDHGDHYGDLGDEEGWFAASGSQGVGGGNLHEDLGDQNEDVEPLRDHGGDDEGFEPAANHFFGVAGVEGDGEGDDGDCAKDVGGHEFVRGEDVAGGAGEESGPEEEGCPTIEGIVCVHGEENDEACSDGYEADDNVNENQGRHSHHSESSFLPERGWRIPALG